MVLLQWRWNQRALSLFQEEYLSLVARLIIHFRDIREYWPAGGHL